MHKQKQASKLKYLNFYHLYTFPLSIVLFILKEDSEKYVYIIYTQSSS